MPSQKHLAYQLAHFKNETLQQLRFQLAKLYPVQPTYPDFIGIGAARSGTTWLYARLSDHPDVHVSKIKELHFFDRAKTSTVKGMYDLSIDNHWNWYYRMLANSNAQMRGEITPAYLILPDETIAQIAQRMPNLKILVSIRNPVSRAWSALRRNIWRDLGIKPSEINEDDKLFEKLMTKELLSRGDYEGNIPRWEKFFSKEQIHVIFFDDIETKPREVINDLCTFLGVDPSRLPQNDGDNDKVNSAPNQEIIPAFARAKLEKYYEKQAQYILDRFGRDCSAWYESGVL